MLLKNAMIYPQTDEAPFIGDVLCKNGKIKAIGQDLETNGEIMDLTGYNLLPGLVDCHSHAGLDKIGKVEGLENAIENSNAVTPEMDVLYSVNPENPNFRYAVENGITTLGILPASTNVIDGTGYASRTWGNSVFEMCLRKNICMKMSLGANPKGRHQAFGREPDSRMGVTFLLEEYLANAKMYMEMKEALSGDFQYNEKYEIAIPVLKREIPARVHCTHNDMASTIEILSKFDVRFTLEHAWGASNYIDEIVRSGCGIVFGPIGGRRSFYESRFVDIDAVGILDKRGVEVSLIVDSPLIGFDTLVQTMEQAVREGTDPASVLKMVTIYPAKVLGLEDRVGSIEVGKDANFAVFKGLPGTDMGAHVVYTICEGNIKYRRKDTC